MENIDLDISWWILSSPILKISRNSLQLAGVKSVVLEETLSGESVSQKTQPNPLGKYSNMERYQPRRDY